MSKVTIIILIEANSKGKVSQLFPSNQPWCDNYGPASGFGLKHGKMTNVIRFFLIILVYKFSVVYN